MTVRVLYIDVNCKNSSTGMLVYTLYQGLEKSGHSAAVCYGRGTKIKEKNIFKFGIDLETFLHAGLTRLTGFTGCYSFISTLRLINYIRKYKPDIVHIHEMHAYFINIGMLIHYLKKHHMKTVMTLHCEFAYTGKCGHALECEKWKTECNHCPHKHDYVNTGFFDHTRYMFRKKKKFFSDYPELVLVTPSIWLTERVEQSFFKNHRIHTIYNGINTDIFYPKRGVAERDRLHLAENEKVILALAPHLMSSAKGGMFILQLAKKLKNYKFILVGVDEFDFEVDENVLPFGAIYDKDYLASLYSIADLFVICSEKETFSLTCAEAICCGTTVAGFRCGAPESVFDEPFATFVEYGNIDKLENVIINKINSPLDRKYIASYGYENFSEKNMLCEYLTLYNSI